jgi:hypothetical protein
MIFKHVLDYVAGAVADATTGMDNAISVIIFHPSCPFVRLTIIKNGFGVPIPLVRVCRQRRRKKHV